VDALTGLLDGPRARGAFLLRSILDPPWSLRIRDGSPLSVITLTRGQAWIVTGGAEPARIEPGDVAVVNGTGPYTVADRPETPVQIVIHPGQRCESADGTEMTLSDLGVRTEISRRLLDAVPALLIRPAAAGDRALIDLLTREMSGTGPAQEMVLDRLLDLLLVSVLRSWLAGPDAGVPGWYRAESDPVVGPALRLMHDDPAYPWTVAELAARTGSSRASLARRFTELVGEPPMAYLTGWRITLAADLLRQADATIGAVARQVGYGSAFALSAAFKRERGMSPQEYRRHDVVRLG
jgi:AraC-like DNA-binding protein